MTDPETRAERARQDAQARREQERREDRKEQACKQAKEHEERAVAKAEKAEQRLEQGKGNPVDVVLYERQQAILENQRAIKAELGIDDE